MKKVVIIQARIGSTRLPRKVLLHIGGQSVLSRVVNRVRCARQVDEVAIATTDLPEDDAIVAEARRCCAAVYRGSQSDVLDRYLQTAVHCSADVIVRITSDCPLIDPRLIDQLLMKFETADAPLDYMSNVHPRSFPHGLDAEVFTIEALKIAHREAQQPHEREHVTPYFYQHPERFRLGNLCQDIDQSRLRWTLDEPDDQRFFEALFQHFDASEPVTTEQVIELLRCRPELGRINAHVQQKPLKAA
jgi:spore coat polysaccharide biosynthesis protein SpsF